MHRGLWTIALAAQLATLPAWAAPAATKPVGVREAVAIAIARNPEIRAADRALDAARARLTQAEAWPNPNLMVTADQVPLTNPGNGNFLAGVTQPLLMGGVRAARAEAARIDVELATIEADLARRALVAQVQEAYARHQSDHAGMRLATLGYEAAAKYRNATAARYKAGEVARIDLLRTELELGRASRDVAAAESREAQSLAELNVLIGREPHLGVEVDTPDPHALPGLPPAPTLLALALKERPELRRAELAIRREAAQRKVAQAGQWTGTEASLAGGMVAGQPGLTAVMTVPVPFYHQQGEIAEAEANRARAEAERDALRFRITLEVEHTYHDALIAGRQAQLFREGYLALAARLADNAQRRYAVGEGSGLEVAEAGQAVRQAQADYQQALLAQRQAVIKLELAVGGWEATK